MKNIRIGKDIALKWTLTVDGVSRDLSVLDLRLFLHNEMAGSSVELAFTTQTDVLRTEVLGRDQRNTGVYRLTLWLNKDQIGQSVLDESTAFRLVARTEMEGGTDDNNLETESVELSGNLTTDGYKDYSELSERVDALEAEMQNKATKEEVYDYALNRTQYHEDHVMVEQVNAEYAQINAATTETAGVMTAAQVQELEAVEGGKQDKVAVVEEDSAAIANPLTPATGTYTRFLYPQESVQVILPAIPAPTYAVALSIYLETGANPQVTFTSADNSTIAYYDGFAIEGNKKYEINCLFNGAQWILAYGTIA